MSKRKQIQSKSESLELESEESWWIPAKIDGFAMTPPEQKRKETKGKTLMMLFDTANNTFDFEMTAGH